MKIKQIKGLLFLICGLWSFASCEKFLDVQTSKTSTVPSTLEDMQALLDAGNKINLGNYPALLEAGTDDFYLDPVAYGSITVFLKDLYEFKNPGHYMQSLSAWVNPYGVVAVANTVLDGLYYVKSEKGLKRANIEGQALFHRAYGHFLMSQLYCEPYDINGDNKKMGIPLRLTSDLNVKSERSSVEDTYRSILSDLEKAAGLLDINLGVATRPNKVAAYAALSKVYHSMEDYEKSAHYADLALDLYSSLIDFNTINLAAAFPFARFNEETIFFAYSAGVSIFNPSRSSFMDRELYDMYTEGDLRKKAFYQDEGGQYTFKGNYTGSGGSPFFVGLTTSELLLNRSESFIRLGRLTEGREDLNTLRRSRYDKSLFEAVVTTDANVLLQKVVEERRKELVRRGIRWSDLRRLNKDDRFKKTIIRKINLDGVQHIFELAPNDPNYIYKIPDEVISMTGMIQN